MKLTDNIVYIGVNDKNITLFEGQYPVEKGMAYNSYVIIDEKIAVMDTVEASFAHEWLDNIQKALGNRKPDYLIVQHMEPDHSANIKNFMNTFPEAQIVGNAKTFTMISQFFGEAYEDRRLVVANGDTLSLGEHELTFVFAPMVHWPEVMMTYDSKDKVLFSADGFGKFGTVDAEEEWEAESARYYFGIVGKYGAQVQAVLKKAAELEIEKILPLHGPMLMGNLSHFTGLYDKWSSYTPEKEGVVIAYTSIYGGTKAAVLSLAEKLRAKGVPEVIIHDLAREDVSYAVSDAFRYNKLVLATTTYNGTIFPHMSRFIDALTERFFQNRTVALIENGTWGAIAAKKMADKLSTCKNLNFCENTVTIKSVLNSESSKTLEALSDELSAEYPKKEADDMRALFKIGYGLYAVTCNDGKKDNGFICNTVSQLTSQPNRVSVTINKANYSHHVIKSSGKMNVCTLSNDAPFELFRSLGFRSGRNADKFENIYAKRSENGLYYLTKCINSYMSLEVEQYVDLGTHGMFICRVTEAKVVSDAETMTYSYYHANVKPKPKTENKKGYVCKICGYIHEGDELPEDFICPICKHGAEDFEKIV